MSVRRIPERGGHYKITGIPYAVIPSLGESRCARTYLYDPVAVGAGKFTGNFSDDYTPSARVTRGPCARRSRHPHADACGRAAQAFAVVNQALRIHNPYTNEYIRWGRDERTMSATLVVKYPGSSESVRAMTELPGVDVPSPRTVLVTRSVGMKKTYLRTDNALYNLLNYPLLFPTGDALTLRPTASRREVAPLDGDGAPFNVQRATLAVVNQPERELLAGTRGRVAVRPFRLVATACVYARDGDYVYRRGSRIEFAGRGGDCYVLEQYLRKLDERCRQLSSESVQRLVRPPPSRPSHRSTRPMTIRRLARAPRRQICRDIDADGGAPSDVPADSADAEPTTARSTRLPANERGSPAHSMRACGQALYVTKETGRSLFFVTFTIDTRWPEIASRVFHFKDAPKDVPPDEVGETSVQEPYDRVALHVDTFEGKRKVRAPTSTRAHARQPHAEAPPASCEI